MENVSGVNQPAFNSIGDVKLTSRISAEIRKTVDIASLALRLSQKEESSLRASISALKLTTSKNGNVFSKIAEKIVKRLTNGQGEQKKILDNIRQQLATIHERIGQDKQLSKKDLKDLRQLYWSDALKIKDPALRENVRGIIKLLESLLPKESGVKTYLSKLKNEIVEQKLDQMVTESLDQMLEELTPIQSQRASNQDSSQEDLSELLDSVMESLKEGSSRYESLKNERSSQEG